MAPTHLRLLSAAGELHQRPPQVDDLAFSARELVLATLPHREPAGEPPVWRRTNGNYALQILPGYTSDPQNGVSKCLGYPYGVIPRLLLFWLTTEALRTRSRRIRMSDTFSGFMRELGLSPSTGGGSRGDGRRLREQMERLFAARISFDYTDDRHTRWLHMEVTSEGELWWDPRRLEDLHVWGSWLELGEKFFHAVTAHPVPIDLRALRALKNSPLALDLYAWLSYRLFTVRAQDRPAFIPWRALQRQLGSNYSSVKSFKRYALVALRKIAVLYPLCPVKSVRGGIEIRPGPLLVPPRTS